MREYLYNLTLLELPLHLHVALHCHAFWTYQIQIVKENGKDGSELSDDPTSSEDEREVNVEVSFPVAMWDLNHCDPKENIVAKQLKKSQWNI